MLHLYYLILSLQFPLRKVNDILRGNFIHAHKIFHCIRSRMWGQDDIRNVDENRVRAWLIRKHIKCSTA